VLFEFPRVRQDPDSYKRLFSDEERDLYVWYDKAGGEIVGFQLVYNREDGQMVYTWKPEKGGDHMGLMDGDGGRFNKTPIACEGGVPDYPALYGEMSEALMGVEPEISRLVLCVLAKEAGLAPAAR
jgi:hypothetical protein